MAIYDPIITTRGVDDLDDRSACCAASKFEGNTDDDLRMACAVETSCGDRFHDAGINEANQVILDYVNG